MNDPAFSFTDGPADLLPAIAPLDDAALHARLLQRMADKTKPLGALGRLEALAVQIGRVLGSERPRLHAPQLLVCAADHGLARQGVSAYPQAVTVQMVANFLDGGAAVSVLARQHGIALTVADCGCATPIASRPGLVSLRQGAGTADALAGPAMTPAQCHAAIAAGRALVRTLPGNALLLGEMGIGNSSAAALLAARLGGHGIDVCCGPGTGLAGEALLHKRAVLRAVLQRHADAREPLAALAALGGFEIATLAGAALQAAAERRVIVTDGFIATSAVLVAARLVPAVLQCCVAAHCSAEPGHALLLQTLALDPLLRLDLRLGEGSGAALAWPLLESACRLMDEMASFASAGVAGRAP